MSTKLDKLIKFLPAPLQAGSNPMLNALISAWAGADDELTRQIENTKAQLFVRTAEGTYLDRLASNMGVSRPFALGLLDSDFQELIPNLSLKQKQLAKSFYDTMDVFWGPRFSRANVTAIDYEPYHLAVGNTFTVIIDGGKPQSLTLAKGDCLNPDAATCDEIERVFKNIAGLNVECVEDPASLKMRLNFQTSTPGPRGSIEFVEGFSAFGVPHGFKNTINSMAQRTAIYQVAPGEVVIEIPAIVPTLRRVLKGSHHFHADSTLAGAIPPANSTWQGGFMYSPSAAPFMPTAVKSTLVDPILKGSVLNQITVADTTAFDPKGGSLIFNFGKNEQEWPVQYLAIPNTNTILIDPSHTFEKTHLAGSTINFLAPGVTSSFKPRKNGADLPVYITSPAQARSLVQEILKSIAAAGVTVSFVVLLPSYKYLISNPFDT